MRIIDADALKESLFDLVAPSGIIYASDMESLIDSAPTIERPHGEWYHSIERGWHCSECDEVVKDMPTCMRKATYKFCPNCGADMRGGKQ